MMGICFLILSFCDAYFHHSLSHSPPPPFCSLFSPLYGQGIVGLSLLIAFHLELESAVNLKLSVCPPILRYGKENQGRKRLVLKCVYTSVFLSLDLYASLSYPEVFPGCFTIPAKHFCPQKHSESQIRPNKP